MAAQIAARRLVIIIKKGDGGLDEGGGMEMARIGQALEIFRR